jgi:hypothetical protein
MAVDAKERFFAPEAGAQNDTSQAYEQGLRLRTGVFVER